MRDLEVVAWEGRPQLSLVRPQPFRLASILAIINFLPLDFHDSSTMAEKRTINVGTAGVMYKRRRHIGQGVLRPSS